MHLVTFEHNSQVFHGECDRESGLIYSFGAGPLDGFLERGSQEGVVSHTLDRSEVLAIDDVTILAPIVQPSQVIASAGNFQAHVTEEGDPPIDPKNSFPRLFLKPPGSLCGPYDDLEINAPFVEVDWEAELAIVVGRRISRATPEQAETAIFGFSVANDISARAMDYGFDRVVDSWQGFFDWYSGKLMESSCPLGPYLVPRGSIDDLGSLNVECYVNERRRQYAPIGEMLFSPAELVSAASYLRPLSPGDVILGGTPTGVGSVTRTYLQDGDMVAASIDGLGRQGNRFRTSPSYRDDLPWGRR